MPVGDRADQSTDDTANERSSARVATRIGVLADLLDPAVVVRVFQPAIGKADPSSPAPGPPASGGAVTLQDLLFAPVPGLCQHDPGNLVNGQLPPQDSHRGEVMIAKRNNEPDNS